MSMFIPLLYFLLQTITAKSDQIGKKRLNCFISQTVLHLSIHHVNKYTRDVHTLSNPVYSVSGKEKVGKGKQKIKQCKQKY